MLAFNISNHSPQKYCKIKPYNKSKTRRDNIEKNSSVHVSDIEIPAIEIKETEEKKEHTSQEYAELEKFVCENYLVDETQIQIEEVR